MKENQKHIYPIFDKMLTRMDKERLLKQHGLMLWFTGLSGSGKSTIAIALERELQAHGNCLSIRESSRLPLSSARTTSCGKWQHLS